MAIVARYYLTETNIGVITLDSNIPFETASWSVQTSDPDNPINDTFFLYANLQSGVGALSSDGLTLTITIPDCPVENFQLTVGSFQKIFNLTDGRAEIGSVIVAANNVKWATDYGLNFGSGVASMALAYFSSTKLPGLMGQNHSARLYQGKKLRCIVFGTTFNSVDGTPDDQGRRWYYSGILFYKFGWIGEAPIEPETFTLLMEAGSRGSGESNMKFEVTLSSTEAIGPTSAIYNVHQDQTFHLDDGWLQ